MPFEKAISKWTQPKSLKKFIFGSLFRRTGFISFFYEFCKRKDILQFCIFYVVNSNFKPLHKSNSEIASKQQRKLMLLFSKQFDYRATEIIYLTRSYKVRHSKVWKVIWLKSIEKMEILTVPDFFSCGRENGILISLFTFSKKEKGNMKN